MATKPSTDLWGHVQRGLLDPRPSRRTVPFPVSRTICLRTELTGWHDDRRRARAFARLDEIDAAVSAGRHRKARRLRADWMHTLHTDRIAHARALAGEGDLRLDPIGRAPFIDTSTVHYRDRLPWTITPLPAYGDEDLPARASATLERWNAIGDVFDRYYKADEPPGSASLPCHSLIGAISTDGRACDWFVLDRWAS